jgi:hypothetical protein
MDNTIRYTQNSYNVNVTGTGKGLAGMMKKESPDLLASIETDRSSVTLSPAALNNISSNDMELHSEQTLQQTSGFSSLSAEDKKRYKDTLMELNKDARLFVMDEKTGQLRRCAAPEVKQAFDNGGDVFLVTRMGKETSSSSGYSNSSDESHGGFFVHKDISHSSGSSSSSKSEYVNYSASKLSSWDDLDFVDTDGKGVPGTPYLPASGSPVQISESWESSWAVSSSYSKFGLIRDEFSDSSAGAHSSYERKAEE